ncbi:MAG: hypothetical protein HGJ94_07885 [Desulfosarcina sp.]|nr:hypothetical protein [Desulfosarcina sp.]
MTGLDDLKIATLSPEDLETIRALEKKLGPNVRTSKPITPSMTPPRKPRDGSKAF